MKIIPTMTQEEFQKIFDSLYYACVQPTNNAKKVYQARQKCYWAHFQHVRGEFFEQAVERYLAEATDGPFFPALGDLREISGTIAKEFLKSTEEAERAALAEAYPGAAGQAAETEHLIANLAGKKRLQ